MNNTDSTKEDNISDKNKSLSQITKKGSMRTIIKLWSAILLIIISLIFIVMFYGPTLIQTVRNGNVALGSLSEVEKNISFLKTELEKIKLNNIELTKLLLDSQDIFSQLKDIDRESVDEFSEINSRINSLVLKDDFDIKFDFFDENFSRLDADIKQLKEIIDLNISNDELEKRIHLLEEALGDVTFSEINGLPSSKAEQGLSFRLAKIEDQITNIINIDNARNQNSNQTDNSEFQFAQNLSIAEKRINKLEELISEINSSNHGTLVIAISQLQNQMITSKSFYNYLAAINKIIEKNNIKDIELISVLRALELMSNGVPTFQDLKEDFIILAEEVVANSYLEIDDSWLSKLRYSLSNAIKVRRVGDVKGNNIEARIARAELHLSNDDLKGAIEEMAKLEGSSAEKVFIWLSSAKSRLQADSLSEALRLRAFILMSENTVE